ncbi:MAG: YdcF family protein [Acidobacteriia bacterium]|nr:YdcF family protein [Terriglobia bacterium]
MHKVRMLVILAGVTSLVMVATSGWFLVMDQPRKADVIVVIAGETDYRPARGLELMSQGYAPRMILNVPAGARVYQWTQPELAQRYIEGLPQASAISICPIYGLSTKAEAQDAARCLQNAGRRVLLVTSDYHTRRALSIFERELPNHDFSVAAAYDPREFGMQWWRRREWAKVNLDEWLRLVWWEAVDRWR